MTAHADNDIDPNLDLAKAVNWGVNSYTGTGPALSYQYSFGQNWSGALSSRYPVGTRTGASNPSAIGSLKVAVIFMDATDRRASQVTLTRTGLDFKLTADCFKVLEPLIDFYWQSSYGQLKVELINVNAEVNNGAWFNGTRTTSNYGTMTTQANEAIAFAVAAGFDFSDINYPAVFSAQGGNPANSMTAHGSLTLPLLSGGSKSTTQYFNIGNNIWSWRRPWTVLAHEMGHTLNMIDLYTYDYVRNETTNSGTQWFQYIGGWDLEGDCNAESPDQLAWHKWKVRWLKDEQVRVVVPNSSQKVTLTANAYWDKDSTDRAADGIKMIYIPTETLRPGTTTQTQTGYVIESRRPIGNDGPSGVAPGSSNSTPWPGAIDQGVLIYRLDSAGPNTTNGGHGRGGIKVIDGNPDGVNNRTQTSSTSLRRACFGFGANQVQTYHDIDRNITIQVVAQDELTDTVVVTYGDPVISAHEEYQLTGAYNTVKIDFKLENSIGLASADFNVNYDAALLKPIAYDISNIPATANPLVDLNYAPGKVNFSYENNGNINLDGALFSLTFEPAASAMRIIETTVGIESQNAAINYNAITMGEWYQGYNGNTATLMMPTYIRLTGLKPVMVQGDSVAVSLKKYDYAVYMQSQQNEFAVNDTVSVDVMLMGNTNYTQISAAITYDADILEFSGYSDLQGIVASVVDVGNSMISVRSLPSLNMVYGEPCFPEEKIVTLEFTVKDDSIKESDLGFASILVAPPGGVIGALTVPGQNFKFTLIEPADTLPIIEEVVYEIE
ncbi:MAG: cohesin domain-containing protein [Firmicutes bacterium]|nr:cohesin domain-containing protein [Bacillota bacterium]